MWILEAQDLWQGSSRFLIGVEKGEKHVKHKYALFS